MLESTPTAAAGTRTWPRRDRIGTVIWVCGAGFPDSRGVSRALSSLGAAAVTRVREPAGFVEALRGEDIALVVSSMASRRADLGVLDLARRIAPKVPRVLLVDPVRVGDAMSAAALAHYLLRVPCAPEALHAVMDRHIGGPGVVRTAAIRGYIEAEVALPAAPVSVARVLEVVDDPETSAGAVARALEQDPALSAEALRLANTATYLLPRRVRTLSQAVSLMGLNATRAMVLSAACTEALACRYTDLVDRVRRRGLVAAELLRHMSGARGDSALTAAVLMDIGQVVLAAAEGDAYRDLLVQAREEKRPLVELEQGRLGVDHAMVGAALLERFGLPDEVVRAVAFSHAPYPHPSNGFDRMARVYVCSQLVEEAFDGVESDALDPAWQARVGLVNHIPRWREFTKDLALQYPND